MLRPLLLALLAGLLAGQKPLEFEVASIRPSAEQPVGEGQAGLQVTQSQLRVVGLPLRIYISIAHKIRTWQVSGPSWLSSTRYDISATLPDGAAAQQVPDMLRTLLTQRFELKTHLEAREADVFELEVARSGLTLKQVPAERDVTTPGALVVSGSGNSSGTNVDYGGGSSYSMTDSKFVGRKLAMEMLARALTDYVGRPVIDKTGAEGFYDLSLDISPEDFLAMRIRAADAAGVSLPPQAIRLLDAGSISSLVDSLKKAGLLLESRRAPMDFLVVDSMNRTPTGN